MLTELDSPVSLGPTRPGPRHLGDDAAELRAVLRERQQVSDGAADGVDVV